MPAIGLLDQREVLDFSENLTIARPGFIGDVLFPDRKTEFLLAEYMTLSSAGSLPGIAPVHAWDTEAVIGERPVTNDVTLEKLLLKKKINQSERLRQRLSYNMNAANVTSFVFDDMARMADEVKAATERQKMQLLSRGQLTIQENNLNMVIDFGVPLENRVTADWTDPDHDILGDIQTWINTMMAQGAMPNSAMTSERVLQLISTNNGIQRAAFGNSGVGTYAGLNDINVIFQARFGFMLMVNNARYREDIVVNGEKRSTSQRFFSEDAFSIFTTNIGGSVGAGLWGMTPEEELLIADGITEYSDSRFITMRQWAENDPAVVWSKASGVFTPVLPDPTGLLTATITLPAGNVAVTGITVGGATTVATGSTTPLTATVAPENATNKTVTWTSGNEAIATVSVGGVVTGVGVGTTTITATAQDGSGVTGTHSMNVS